MHECYYNLEFKLRGVCQGKLKYNLQHNYVSNEHWFTLISDETWKMLLVLVVTAVTTCRHSDLNSLTVKSGLFFFLFCFIPEEKIELNVFC